MFMFNRRSKQAASPELRAAVDHLKRNGYAVGSPVMSLSGRMWLMVGGRLYWEEQAVEMAATGSTLPETDTLMLPVYAS